MLTPRGCSLLHNFSSFKYSFTIPKHFMCKVLILSTPATFVDIILTATAQKKRVLWHSEKCQDQNTINNYCSTNLKLYFVIL